MRGGRAGGNGSCNKEIGRGEERSAVAFVVAAHVCLSIANKSVCRVPQGFFNMNQRRTVPFRMYILTLLRNLPSDQIATCKCEMKNRCCISCRLQGMQPRWRFRLPRPSGRSIILNAVAAAADLRRKRRTTALQDPYPRRTKLLRCRAL